ncbi:MAG: carotenoid oxygenase family protein [Acidimicrobiales bacterium]|nr:carotenoid oxygenase family protein [Acidimicrobiales bacterium]
MAEVPEPYDPARPYWLQGNFAPVDREVDVADLPVEGSLPAELRGLYVRNGSNPATGESPHWFLGDGMVHGIRIEDGKARWYRNRYVRTTLFERRGGLLTVGPPGGAANQSNVSVVEHAGRLLSLGEIGYPYELVADDLSTRGVFDYDGQLTTAMTAHPKIHPSTGKLHFFGYGFVPPYLTYHIASPSGTLEYTQEVGVRGPTMIHDFAITDRDAVFWELPVVFDLQAAIQSVSGGSGEFPFRWEPSYGARVGIMPLEGPTSAIRWVEIDPCYVFHGANAYRDGDSVVLDVCRLESAFASEDFGQSSVRRWRIDTSGPSLRFAEEILSDVWMDLPAIDRRFTGQQHSKAWYLTVDDGGSAPFEFSGILALDSQSGSFDRWEPGPVYRAGEVVFAPAGSGEGEGWLLLFAYDKRRGASDFVVLDATNVRAGPVARVALPVRVPYGFHGWWVPDA